MSLPRFERRPDLVGGIRIQERDLEIIRLLYDYRFLNSHQLTKLIDGSYQTICRRLRKLYHHGYIDRPKSQLYLGWHKPRSLVYALGDRGADLLVENLGLDREVVGGNWRKKNREVKYRYIEHSLMISDFRACLWLALKGLPKSDLLFWEKENPAKLKDEVYFRKGGTKTRVPIVPDGFFAIQDRGDELYFFLEADRGTTTNRRFLKKMEGYWKYWRQGRHKRRFGIQAFRVLTVTTSTKRKENLREVTKKADDKNVGSLIFWFTSEEEFTLSEPAGILDPIWQTPKNDGWHQILE